MMLKESFCIICRKCTFLNLNICGCTALRAHLLCENHVHTLPLQPFSAQMAGLDEKSGLGSQVGFMPGSVVSINFTDNQSICTKMIIKKETC